MKGVQNNKFYNLVAPSYFCTWFGLIQIQAKVNQPIKEDFDKGLYKDVCGTDHKDANFGYYEGRIVCCDYP